jgi:methyl halide transferase
VSAPPFWADLYARGQDGWDLGAPSPPLATWLAQGGRFPGTTGAAARVAVPGCGRGHDVRLLARQGYRVTGFDFADAAIAEARALADADGVEAAFEQRDIFTLTADHGGAFDALWEYTCFCAIDPGRREEYARLVHALLRPGGILLGCFFPLREGTDGPPFPVSHPEIERVLAPWFDVLEAGPPAESVEQRRGLEWLVRARRRDPGEPAAR